MSALQRRAGEREGREEGRRESGRQRSPRLLFAQRRRGGSDALSEAEKKKKGGKMSGNTRGIHLAFRLYETQKFIPTITLRQIAFLLPPPPSAPPFPAVRTTENSLRNWKMMKYSQLGLRGGSSSNIAAVSFLLIAQSLELLRRPTRPPGGAAARANSC